MAIMFGNGTVQDVTTIRKTQTFTATDTSTKPTSFTLPGGGTVAISGDTVYDANGSTVTQFTVGQQYFQTFDVNITGSQIVISANSFPGTYYVTGDTYARSEVTGKDEFFQFIVSKAKMQAENTITLEAEGDPSVFNMNLRVMRPANGEMMKLVKYNINEG